MIANIPKMSYAERQFRADQKTLAVAEFLAGGETYSTPQILAQLLQIDRSRAVALCQSMEKRGFLKSESHYIESRTQKVYGISPAGLALADLCHNPAFELGRTNSGWIPHRLDTQKIHIKAAALGWTNWTPERILKLDKSLKKLPDAAATNPQGQRIAIEIERSVKTAKRYAEVLIIYLKAIKSGTYAEVHYISPPAVAHLVERTIRSIKSVKVGGEVVQITDAHLLKFKFFTLDEWPVKKESEEKNGK